MKQDANTTIGVEILVPVKVDPADRPRLERALIDFVFAPDRVRPELHDALRERGVDVKQLAQLCQPRRLGVCPAPEALQFIPSEHLMQLARERGIDLTGGGRVALSFDHDAYAGGEAAPDRLEIRLSLPEGLGDADETVADVVRALFGDCELSSDARDYLRAHGVDLDELADENSHRLDGGRIPPTTRAEAGVARILAERGLTTDRLGTFNVASIRDTHEPTRDDIGWSRVTCC